MPKLNNSESGKKENDPVKKHRGAAKPRKVVDGGNNLLTTRQIAQIVTDFIPPPPPPPPPPEQQPPSQLEAQLIRDLRMREMDRLVEEEEDRMAKTAMNPNAMVSLYERKVYLNCGHRVPSFINSIKLGAFYYCDECRLHKKIQEVVY